MRDPRLRLARVITLLQFLGQVALGFDLSIAQIVLPILACALVEVAVTWRRTGSLVWPASAMLTGGCVGAALARGTLRWRSSTPKPGPGPRRSGARR